MNLQKQIYLGVPFSFTTQNAVKAETEKTDKLDKP